MSIKKWYQLNISKKSENVSVRIPKRSIEKVVDDYNNIYYSVSIFIKVDGYLLKPSEHQNLNELLLEAFKLIEPSNNNKYFKNSIKTYKTSKAFKFYFSKKIMRNTINLIGDYIRRSFESTNQNYLGSQVNTRLQQDVILYSPNENARIINCLFAFITNYDNTIIYDSKIENTSTILKNLKKLIDNIEINSNSSENGKSEEKIELLMNINEENLMEFCETFTIYLKNDYLTLNTNDLIKISSWLSDIWALILKDNQVIIRILNQDIFIDQNDLIIGLNYMVAKQAPECQDLKEIEKILEKSFDSIKQSLCSANYQFYVLKNDKPKKYFFKVDLVGEINYEEEFHRNLIKSAILNGWKREYIESYDISMPVLANNFQININYIGTIFTRVYYLIYLNNQQAINGFHSSPSYSIIQNELEFLGSDMKVISDSILLQNSLPFSHLSSLFIPVYPLELADRNSIEIKINSAIQKNQRDNSSVFIMYQKLYKGTRNNRKYSRIYYSVKFIL